MALPWASNATLFTLFLAVLVLASTVVFYNEALRRMHANCRDECQTGCQTKIERNRAIASQEEQLLSQMGNGTMTSVPQVALFSTWVSRPNKRVIHRNVLRTWPLISPPTVVCLLFSEEAAERQRARSFQWLTPSFPRTACGGVPILREMFYTAMRTVPTARLFGFVNGDLLLGPTLKDSLQSLLESPTLMSRSVLVLLCRSNVPFNIGFDVKDLRGVEALKPHGRLVTDGSSDAFFTNRLFPWQLVPDVVPGRLGVGMWLVAAARALNVTVIDLSPTVTTLHMTSSSGNRESLKHANTNCNHKLISTLDVRPSSWHCGFIKCADVRSDFAGNGSDGVRRVRIRSRSQANMALPKGCQICRFNMTSLLKLRTQNPT